MTPELRDVAGEHRRDLAHAARITAQTPPAHCSCDTLGDHVYRGHVATHHDSGDVEEAWGCTRCGAEWVETLTTYESTRRSYNDTLGAPLLSEPPAPASMCATDDDATGVA